MKKTLLIILGSALAAGAAIKAEPAFSQPHDVSAEANVSIVRTADLDLSTKAGQRQLERRLITAAREVCGEAFDSDLKGQNDVRRCREDVLFAARAKADEIVAGTRTHQNFVIAAQ
jgi:UrcA family protein